MALKQEGLKWDLIQATVKAMEDTGIDKNSIPEIKEGVFIERVAHYQAEAIATFISSLDFTITKINAPVQIEELKSDDLPANIEIDTLLGEYQPVLKTLRKLAEPVGLGSLIDSLEDEIKKAVTPLLEGGAKTPFNLPAGVLQSKAYVIIGEDPESVENFNVDDEDGQRQNTTVKVFREDIEDYL
jgi:hypothetical protein